MNLAIQYSRGAGRAALFASVHGLQRQQRTTSSNLLCKVRNIVTTSARQLPRLRVSQLKSSMQLQHVQTVSKQLESTGILKIDLAFCDDGSRYLEQLLLSLHKYLDHRLPISHSATRGWFWDIRPSAANFQTANYQARSETMEEFAWHTDCSYEDPTPRYFALQVLQPDRYGGGVLSLMNVQRLSERLSSTTRAALMRPEYRITIPPEFYKESEKHYIDGSLLAVDSDGRPIMRFRGDIIQALTTEASRALDDLKRELKAAAAEPNFAMQLSAEDLPERTIVLVDNRRWLHARSPVMDAARHLRRVRWDAVPFHGIPRETKSY